MRDENYYSSGKSNNTGLIVIVTLLVVAVVGLIGFIVYDKVINKTNEPNMEENNKDLDEQNKEENNDFDKGEIKLTKDEKISYNTQLKTIWFSLYRVLGKDGDLDFSKLKSGTNLIETKDEKMEFLWELISRDESINKTKDVNGTGSISVKLSDFIEKYKEVYNENITQEDISNNYTVKNNVVYGNYYTGFVDEFAIKAEKITKTDSDSYQLETSFVVLENDVESFESCRDENIISCSESVKYGNLLIEYAKNDKTDYLISITFEK